MRIVLDVKSHGETLLTINGKELHFNRPDSEWCTMFIGSRNIPREKLILLFAHVKTSLIDTLYVPYIITKIIIEDDTITTIGEGPWFRYTTVSTNDIF